MTRYTKNAKGQYQIKGKSYDMLEGSRAQVWHGTAYKTSGGLKKVDIMMNKSKRIVSRLKHASASKEKRLIKAGYGTKKGKFGFVRLNGSKSSRGSKKSRRSKKKRGGKTVMLSPLELSN